MMKRLIFYVLIFLTLGITACASGGSETAVAQTNPIPEITNAESCPVTQPQSPQFVPPKPYPEADPGGGFWYGTADLWTDLRPEGLWYGLPKSDAGYGNKLALWREGYSMTAEPEPEIILSARQLDGAAMVEPIVHGTNAYHPDYGQFMMTGIELPTLGCWEITAEYKEATLSFVVWVAP
jgi:hypothetical protein